MIAITTKSSMSVNALRFMIRVTPMPRGLEIPRADEI